MANRELGLTSLRAAIIAMNEGLLREFTRAAFARNFVTRVGLTNLDDVLAVADEVGLDLDTVMHGVTAEDIENQLTGETDAAITAGAVGVPTVPVSGQRFWGDERREPAASAISQHLS
jgi:2-hydroxychromene-2-carboxylate isomerase